MRVAYKISDAHYYITPRQTSYGDFAAKLILLILFTLGYAARLGGMEAVYLVVISSLLTHDTGHSL